MICILRPQYEALMEAEKELTDIRAKMAVIGKMLAIYGEEPNDKGQISFNGAMMHSAELACIAIAYPLIELCSHEIDEQAGICEKCGVHEETLRATGLMEEKT
jgi:hypothetical protein